MEYSELYDNIQDVTNDVILFCGIAEMTTSPNQSKYKKEIMKKMSSLATELSNVAHELNEHLTWDYIKK